MKNEFSGTIENQKTNQIKEDRKRGHINSEGIFFLNPKNYASYKIERTTDRNYTNTYKYKYNQILESNIKLESLRGYNSFSLESYPFQLSGGLAQRVVITMAMINKPDLLLADEPSTALDVTIQNQALDLMDELTKETNTAVLLITHNMGVVRKFAEKVA